MYTKCQMEVMAAQVGINKQSVAKKVQGYAAMQHSVASLPT
jgi:hypothetical protein